MAKLNQKNEGFAGVQSKAGKLFVAASLVISCIASMSTASAQYKEFTRLGTSTSVCRGGVETAEQLQAFFANNPNAIADITADAGFSGSAQQIADAITYGQFYETSYAPGTTFEWMSRKKGGKYESLPKRIWAGQSAFEGFELSVVEGCTTHQIVIPKACCNLSLAQTTSITSQPKLEISTDGQCATACTTPGSSLYGSAPGAGESALSLDGNGCATMCAGEGTYGFRSTDSCGESYGQGVIAAAPVVVEPAPAPAPAPAPIVKKPVAEKIVKAAKYLPFIAPFVGSESTQRFEAAWQEYRTESSGLLGLRGGVKLPLGKGLYAVPALGIHSKTSIGDGFDEPEEGINVDFGLEKYITEKFFVGAGVGKWNIDDSDFDKNSVFLNAGGDLSPKSEWFVEARGLDSDAPEDGYSDNKAYGAGVRLKF